MSFDLDAIVSKKRYVKLNGKELEILDLNTKEYLVAQAKLTDLSEIEEAAKTMKEAAEMTAEVMKEYLLMVLDITEDEAEEMNYRQFRALREYLDELDLLDQGFTKQEIDVIKKRASKNRMEQTLKYRSIGPIGMLQRLAEVHGWHHDEMLSMKKRILFRYYGYWYIAQLKQQEKIEREQEENRREQKRSEPRDWKSF